MVVYGFYGAATTLWGMSPAAKAGGDFHKFWGGVTFSLNGLVGVWGGVRWQGRLVGERWYEQSVLLQGLA